MQAKDIAADLGRVGGAIDGVRDATMAVTEAFGSIVSKTIPLDDEMARISGAMREQGAGGAQLLDELAQLKTISGDVTRSAAEMSSGNELILERVTSLKALNGAVLDGEREILSGTAEIGKAVSDTTSLASENASAMRDALEAAARFSM